MEPAGLSGASTPIENEPVMDCCLVPTTLSGMTMHVSLSVAKFDRFEDFEDQVMDYLASVFFFHEYGRRVGMVPRSSLKEGKSIRWWRKGHRQSNNKPNKTNHSLQAETPPPSSISSVLG